MQATWTSMIALPATLSRIVGGAVRPIGRLLSPWVRPVLDPFCRPGVPLVMTVIGVLAALSFGSRVQASGIVASDSLLALTITAIAFVLAAAPLLTGKVEVRLPAEVGRLLSRVPAGARQGIAIGCAALVVAGGGWLAWSRSGPVSSIAAIPGFGTAKTVEGRASAVAADMIRVNNTLIRLADVETPEARQRCVGPGKRTWRCGEAASEILAKATRGKIVRCEMRGADETGRALGRCYAGAEDIAERLVREGGALATGGLLPRYRSAESEARANKAGVWKSAEFERPADFRARLWEAARKAAPEGCPIKGQVASDRRTYVLPWSPDYDRVKVRTTKGERWFCSEREAANAGFKLAERG